MCAMRLLCPTAGAWSLSLSVQPSTAISWVPAVVRPPVLGVRVPRRAMPCACSCGGGGWCSLVAVGAARGLAVAPTPPLHLTVLWPSPLTTAPAGRWTLRGGSSTGRTQRGVLGWGGHRGVVWYPWAAGSGVMARAKQVARQGGTLNPARQTWVPYWVVACIGCKHVEGRAGQQGWCVFPTLHSVGVLATAGEADVGGYATYGSWSLCAQLGR